MASRAARRVNKPFDPVKFDSLIEPLSVRVEKERGGSRSKIPLPLGEDGSAEGENLGKDAVRGLEEFLLNKWSGGGFYIITVTDSTVPTPQVLEWDIWYSPVDYPERTPPSLAEAAGLPPIVPITSAPQIPPPLAPQVPDMAPPVTVFPHALPSMYASPRPQVAQPQAFDLSAWNAWNASQYAHTQPQRGDDTERRRLEDELRRRDEELRKRDLETAQAKYASDLERERRDARDAQQRLETQLAEMRQQIAQSAAPKANAEVDALKATLLKLEAERENDRRERDAERREREMRDTVARQAEESRKQIEELRRQNEETNRRMMEQMAVMNTTKGPDPMLTLVQGIQRDTMEAMKEMSRNNADAISKLQTSIMHPRELFGLIKESSASVDQVTSKMAQSYTSLFDLHQRATENLIQLGSAGASDQKIALIEKGIERASSWAERYFSGKSKEVIAAEQSKAQMAQAQAQAMTAQAQAMTVQAQMAKNMPPAAAGAVAGAAAAAPTPSTTPVAPGVPVHGNTGPVTIAAVDPNAPRAEKRMSRTDAEWFGVALGKVLELREGIARFSESVQMKPPRLLEDGSIDGMEPLQSVHALDQAIAYVVAQKIYIPAMEELLKQNRVDDFVSIVMPDAPMGYRADVVQLLIRAMAGEDIYAEPEEEDDEAAPINGAPQLPAPVSIVPPQLPASA